MANDIVKELIDGLETVIAAQTGFIKLDYVFEISKNKLNRNYNRFGVRANGFTTENLIVNHMVLDQEFEIILMDRFVNKQGQDTAQQDAVNALFEKLFDAVDHIFLTKAGKPALVMSVDRISTDSPEFIETENLVLIRSRLNIKYRKPVNL